MRRVVLITIFLIFVSVPATAMSIEEIPLTHTEAIERATTNNYDVVRERAIRDANQFSGSASRESFVPLVTFDSNYNDRALRNGRFSTLDSVAALTWTLPSATRLSLGTRLLTDFEDLPGSQTTAIFFDARQSILDGFNTGDRTIEIAERDVTIAGLSFVENLNAILLQVDEAYWDLVFAQSDLQIKNKSIARAQKQFDETTENIKRGLLAPGEIYVVEEDLVFSKQQQERAREAVLLAQTRLAEFIGERIKPGVVIIATSTPTMKSDLPSTFDAKSHPSVQIEVSRMEQAELQSEIESNRSLPTLDLTGGVTSNGAASEIGASYGETFGVESPDFRLGIAFSMPLWGAAANARKQQADARSRAQKNQVLSAVVSAERRMQDAKVRYETKQKTLNFSKRRLELSRKKLDNELEKYKSGISRLPEVVRFQRDLDSADIALKRAELDLVVFLHRWWGSQGKLPTFLGVDVQ